MTHIMLDLETWGKRPGCDIRSIGAVVFDPEFGTVDHTDKYDPEFGCIIHNTFYVATYSAWRHYPLTRDPETVKWWSEQSEAAQGAFDNPVELREALGQFATWFTDFDNGNYASRDIKLWANDPHFDVSILQAAYHAVGLDEPWHYRAPRSMKTVTDLAGLTRDDYCDYGDEHNALHDAIAQAMTVCKAYERLGLVR